MEKLAVKWIVTLGFLGVAALNQCHEQLAPNTLEGVALAKAAAGDCAFDVDPEALIPMTQGVPYIAASDESGTTYPSFLYDGSNNPPQALLDRIAAQNIQPINGKIVVAFEGMSNSRDVFNQFVEDAENNPDVNNDVVVFDMKARGGCDLKCWVDGSGQVADDPSAVQVMVMYHSNNRPQDKYQNSKRFPAHALETKGELLERFSQVKSLYPNLKLIVINARSYAGWSCGGAKKTSYREPVAYEEGFAVKWAIEDANADQSFGIPVMWGAYFWEVLPKSYYKDDGVHPGAALTQLVSDRYMAFFQDPDIFPWFGGDGGVVDPPPPPPPPPGGVKINSGGNAIQEFSADMYFNGGREYNTGGLGIYATVRGRELTYEIPTTFTDVIVRLHFYPP
jgi:hypothetical protein